jgi:hypothetical protein
MKELTQLTFFSSAEIVSVDKIGEVVLQFRGANRVQQGLELALMDIPFVQHVTFKMGEN